MLSVRTDEGPDDEEQDESGSGAEDAVADAEKDERTGESSDSGERSESDSASDYDSGDGRLRDAVAAWVASADEDEDEGEKPAGAEAQDADSEGAGRDSADAGKTGKTGKADAENADGPAEETGKTEDTGAAEGGNDSAEAETDTEADQEAEDDEPENAGEAESSGEAAAEAGKHVEDDDEAENADQPATAAGKHADDGDKAESSDEPAAEAGNHAEDDDKAENADQPAAEAGKHADNGDKAESSDEPAAAAGKVTEDGREASDGADEPADAPEGGQEAVEAASEAAQGHDEADEEAEEREADRSATDTDASDDEAKADAEAAPKADKGTDDTTATASDADSETGSDAAKSPKADDGEGDGGKDTAERPVDQPTAIFKAPRPPVDQPTTMLKLGGVAKDVKGAEAAPEREAERTSKFVALKPLDDPSTRKPASTGETPQATPAAQAAPADATAPVPTVGPERTTQQPLPPKPPLDLLAELTNTPPPPDTPLRTAVRRVKIWTPLALLLVVLLAVAQSVRPLPAPTLELTAKDSYTFEGGKVDIPWPDKGQAALDVQGIGTFGSSGEQKPVPIASVAKVMTAYLILREHPLKSGAPGPKIEIDQAAEDQSDAGQESTVDVTKGDKITQREALESILIASANNIARLLARWDAGSEKSFVQKMNDAAEDLGMKNTTYTDPSGLNNTTVSTAVDQVKLAKAAMQQPAFREVAAMMSYVDYKGTKHDNWNRLVGYNDVTGIKTGTTTSALGNLVFAAKKDVDGETRRIIGAVVRQPAGGPDNTILGAALHEGDQLIRAAQGALESATILKKGDVVGYADDGLGGRTPVEVTEDVTAVGWAGLSVKLTFAADELPHTAEAGAKVGTLTVGDGTTSAVKVPVALQKDLVEPGFADKLTRLG
ncbi:D-alanyl-D-alanine carboxypeptidase [Streptomyces venetus]|uniref:D-alanyl-D-alanine carboxypeptidase n=1 Tax=Streptomyces venetus TaxID=1701086 RepID=UPI003C304FE6